MTDLWPATLTKLLAREDLTTDEATDAMRRIMIGEATPAQIAAFVVALRAKGETPGEVAGLAEAMLELAPRVTVPGPVVDTCGTGGDRAGTINVSTLAAIVAAGAGAVVAKHGNRAASSGAAPPTSWKRWGSGWPSSPRAFRDASAECGIGFMFAPVFHAAMAHAAGPRKEMGIPTVFNFLGPAAPTRPGRRRRWWGCRTRPCSPSWRACWPGGGTRAYVFRGGDGLDELTTTGPSAVSETDSGEIREFELDPATLGLAKASPGDLAGGDPARNAEVSPRRPRGAAGAGPRHRAAQRGGGAARRRPGRGPRPGAASGGGVGGQREGVAGVLARWVEVSNA